MTTTRKDRIRFLENLTESQKKSIESYLRLFAQQGEKIAKLEAQAQIDVNSHNQSLSEIEQLKKTMDGMAILIQKHDETINKLRQVHILSLDILTN